MSICHQLASRLARWRFPVHCLAITIAVSGCTTNKESLPKTPRDHAFIHYWGPQKESKGLRLAVKDLIDVRGVVTTAGSEHFAKTHPPAKLDAECLEIARERGVQIVGKANVSELALGVSGMNEYFGTPKSPLKYRRKLIPGGSSSGSAVAVATGMADISFGTDTAGSIRVPAACCGVFGLKTTYGLVPLKGVVPISPKHLDTVGPLAKDVPRLVQGMDLLQRGFASKYHTTVAQSRSPHRITIGRVYVGGTDPTIDRSIDEALHAAGFRVVRMSERFHKLWKEAQSDGRNLAVADSWVTDRKYLDTPGVSVVTKAIIRLGEIEYATNYQKLLQRRKQWQRDLKYALQHVDFIAVPTLQGAPPKIPFWGRSAIFEARVLASQNTAAVNLAGNPALAVPIPTKEKKIRMTSVQLIGPRLSEARLINAGRLLTTPPATAVATRATRKALDVN